MADRVRLADLLSKRGISEQSAPPKKKERKSSPPKLSRQRKPDDMPLDVWQRELRKQFGQEQKYLLNNIGDEPVFSEFLITNPESHNSYRVAIRGELVGDNFCSCPDFATNSLGTCKHIEFTLNKLAHTKGGKAALATGFRPGYSEVFVQYGSRREVIFRPGAQCSPELARLAGEYFDDEGKLLADAYGRFEVFLAKSHEFESELRCYEDVLGMVAEVRDAQRRRASIDEEFSKGIRSPAFNKLLKAKLYDYQREGALFAAKAGRALIGDEMGLGKTVQALAVAEILAQHAGVERVLIVCPTSLKHQWEREIAKFTERDSIVIGGLAPQRAQLYAAPSFFKITNYDTLHRDLDVIKKWSPDLVILDEAQRIKNWGTQTARTVKKIHSPHALVLTGTPLENRLEELVSIVQFVDQHRLGPTYRFLHDHQVIDEFGRVVGYRDLDRISHSLEPILIRRKKKEVLEQLPPRIDQHFFVLMTPQQQKMHDENRETVARVVAKWRRYGFLPEADQRRLMISLQNMRMVCDSTYLLDQKTDSGVKADELVTLLEELFEQPDTKVVVFSQWLRMHELLIRRLEGKHWSHVLFHGGVPEARRQELVDQFRNDPQCRIFLATDAGGVGLNLQHASVVVNMDMPWNPAVLEQRVARVYRLGQSQPVSVFNFVAKGTIEEGMLSTLSFKKSLFEGVLDGGEKEVFLGGTRLTKFLETVEKVTTSITAPAVEEASEIHVAEEGETEQALLQPSEAAAPAPQPVAENPMAGLLQSGVALLEQLAAASHLVVGNGAAAKSTRAQTPVGQVQVERDEQTGGAVLKIQLPEPEVLERTLRTLASALEKYR